MGSNPGLSQGQVPTAGQWNAYFAAKQDNLNFVPVNSAGGTLTGPLITTASIAAAAGFNIPAGIAPTFPNPGDIWNTGPNLFFESSGSGISPLNQYNGIVLQAGRLTPAGTTGTGAMMGLGGTATLTPLYSSRALISFTGYVTNGTAGLATIKLYNGTGAFPANGAAPTGSQVGGVLQSTISAAGSTPFTFLGVVTGLSPGTAYWFDLALGSGAGTTFLVTSSITIKED